MGSDLAQHIAADATGGAPEAVDVGANETSES